MVFRVINFLKITLTRSPIPGNKNKKMGTEHRNIYFRHKEDPLDYKNNVRME